MLLTTPGRRKMDDKENIGSVVKPTGKSVNPGLTPARKPLAWINQDVTTSQRRKSTGKVLHKTWSTAGDGTPSGITAGMKTSKKRKSRGPFLDSSTPTCTKKTAMSTCITEAAEAILNEVLLEEIADVPNFFQKEGATRLIEYNERERSHTVLEKAVSVLVKNVLEAALKELRDEQVQDTASSAPVKTIWTESLSVVTGTPASEHLWHIALGIDESCDNSTCSSDSVFKENACDTQSAKKSGARKEVCNADTILDATPDEKQKLVWNSRKDIKKAVAGVTISAVTSKTVDCGAQMKSLGSTNVSRDSSNETNVRKKFVATSPVQLTGTACGTTPVKYTDAICETTPVKQMDIATVTIPVTSVDANIGTTPIKPVQLTETAYRTTPVKYTDSNCETTPAKQMDIATVTTPVTSVDANIGTTPIKPVQLTDAAYGTTPVKYTDANCETTPVKQMDIATVTTPVTSVDANIGTTSIKPVQLTDAAYGTTPVKYTDANCETTPVKQMDIATVTTPITSVDANIGTTPIKPVQLTDAAWGTTPIKYTDANCETTPVKQMDIATVTTPVTSVDANIGTTPIKPVQLNDAAYGTTPVKQMNIATGTTPVTSVDANIGTTPIKPVQLTDAAYGTTPLKYTDANCETTPITSVDANIGTTPIKPVEMLNKSSMVTPVKMTTPVKLADVGLCTDQVNTIDCSTGTSPLSLADIAVGTTPLKTADAMCGPIPVMLVDSRCGTTPCSMTEVGTAVTPLVMNVAETLTSPLVVPAFRLEAESPSQLDPISLMSHMETASISNELLRREIKALQNQLDQVRSHRDEKNIADFSQEIEARQTLQANVDDLLQQVGEQMNQITALQEASDQKSAKFAALEQDKISLRDGYQKELHNLQEDLRRAYKQHQQEVSALHEFYEQNNYEPHYKRAMATVTELKTEIKAYTDLRDMLDKATEVQAQFGCVEEAYTVVNTLFKKTMDRRDELDERHKEMLEEMTSTNAQNELLQQQLAAAEEQQQRLQTQLDDAVSAENNAVECQGQLTQELEEASRAMDGLKAEIHITKLELFGYMNDYESVKSQNHDLEQQCVEDFLNVSTLEAALAIQGQQCQDVMVERERLRSKMDELQKENGRLVDDQLHLQSQLSAKEDLISVMQSELEQTKKMLHEQGVEMESMKVELRTNRQARIDAQIMARQIQTLHKQFKENIDFVEEERLALVDSSREAEEQLKITTLEMSRLQGALAQAEETSAQWKAAADNLSEEFQVCQSELDHTKANAHWMLLNQASEIQDAATSLVNFRQKIKDVYSRFKTNYQEMKAASKNTDQETDKSPTSKLNSKAKPHAEVTPSSSLVASILSAINATDDAPNHENHPPTPQAPTTSDDQHSSNPSPSKTKLAIGASGSSAFTTVQPCTNQNSPLSEDGTSEANDASLVSQVEGAREWFSKLLQLLLARNETLESSVLELQEESGQLNKKLMKCQKDYDCELSELREKLNNSELQEQELRQDVTKSNAALGELQQELQYTVQQVHAMADKLARSSSEYKMVTEKFQTEMTKLNRDLRLVQRERDLIQEQLDGILSSCSRSTGAEDVGMTPNKTAANSKLIKENLRLKKELEKLQFRQVEQQEHYDVLNARASRHMQVMEDNWHKADAEVYRLDELFDHCKQLMEKVPSTTDEPSNSSLATLRELLS